MLTKYITHNLFKTSTNCFTQSDPQLRALSQLKYQYKLQSRYVTMMIMNILQTNISKIKYSNDLSFSLLPVRLFVTSCFSPFSSMVL